MTYLDYKNKIEFNKDYDEIDHCVIKKILNGLQKVLPNFMKLLIWKLKYPQLT